jgi:signal peptidase I
MGRPWLNSRDSRSWGFLPIDQVKGRALLVYWSYNASKEEYQRTGVWPYLRDTAVAFWKTNWKRSFTLIR